MLAQTHIPVQRAFQTSRPRATQLSTRSRQCVAVRSAAQESPSGSPVLEWTVDTEDLKGLMGFAGSAPERINGRVAMIGYASLLASELSTHTTVLEQLPNHLFAFIAWPLVLSVASLVPKFVTGTSLKELHAAAKPESLEGAGAAGVLLQVIDSDVELWVGRIAMLGLVGTALVEAGLGKSIF